MSDREEDGTLELYCTDSVELFAENVDTFWEIIKISQYQNVASLYNGGRKRLDLKKDVTISLISTQSDGTDTEQTELITQGRYMKTADGYVLSYDETEATGFEGAVTQLEVTGSRKIVMTRSGTVSSNLVIEPVRNIIVITVLHTGLLWSV